MAVKAINNTASPNGLVSTLLVYEAYLRIGKLDPFTPSVIVVQGVANCLFGP